MDGPGSLALVTYDVLVDDLRSAAGDYRGVAASLGTSGVTITHITPDSLGHVELAAWLEAVAEQCANATRALHDGANDLGTDLDTAATGYETSDHEARDAFTSPFGPSSPFLGPPFAPGGAP